MQDTNSQPSPELLWETITAYQRTAAIQAAIDLELFTAIGEGHDTAPALAERCRASERGVRILADYLTLLGFLTKNETRYGLTPDTATFLDRRSPAYMGGITEFMLAPTLTDAFRELAAGVRKGGTALPEEGTVTADNPVWVRFARAMMPMMAMPAQQIADLVACDPDRKLRLLDIAAGHGIFGIAFARRYPQLEVAALDWPQVLKVARENAREAGVEDRYHLLPGSAFEVEYGAGYDLVLLTNFLHHFDIPTCEALLRRIRPALKAGGRVVTLEFVPNEDRVSPPNTAGFSLVMLATTPRGDAYTFSQLEGMFQRAGFSRSELYPLPPSPEQVVISYT
jgi:ubiquinone/menaquinone biosynthesis C-methylase UbiE